MIQVASAAATHVGRVRPTNEDSYLTLPDLVLVADGMGGHACGDVASALTVTAFEPLGTRSCLHADDVTEAVDRANQAIVSEALAHPEKAGMGTTVTGVAVVDEAGAPHWLVFNIGDSRVYRIEGGVARQLTVDHSEVAELVAAGRITPDDARVHPLRNVITRSLGMSPPPVADTWLVPVEPGDLFLVCSDGLTNELDDAEIAELVTRSGDIEAAAAALVEAALAAGGHDNVTVILASTADDRPADTDSLSETDTLTLPRKNLDASDVPA